MIRGSLILFVFTLLCALARAEGEASRLQTPEGQLQYLWQRQQEDPSASTVSLSSQTLQQTLSAIGGRMNSVRSVFQPASSAGWTWQPNQDPPAALAGLKVQLYADLAQLPLETFTTPEADWAKLRSLPGGQALRKTWLRLAPMIYSGFFWPNDKPLTHKDVKNALSDAVQPQNILKLRILYLDYAQDTLYPSLVSLKGLPKVDDAWNGHRDWKALMWPRVIQRTNFTPSLRPQTQAWQPIPIERPLTLRELPAGQIPRGTNDTGSLAAQRAGQYALVEGAHLFVLTRGDTKEPIGWVLSTNAQYKQERVLSPGPDQRFEFFPHAAKQPYVIDARGLDGEPLAPDLLTPALHLVAAAQDSPGKIVVSPLLKTLAPQKTAQAVRADLPRGWLTVDSTRRREDRDNPYTDELLSNAHAIELPTPEGAAYGFQRPPVQVPPLKDIDPAQQALLAATAQDAKMALAQESLKADEKDIEAARATHALLQDLRDDKVDLFGAIARTQTLPPQLEAKVVPLLVERSRAWEETDRLLLAANLGQKLEPMQRLALFNQFSLRPGAMSYASRYATWLRAIIDKNLSFNDTNERELSLFLGIAPPDVVARLCDELARGLPTYSARSDPKVKRADLAHGLDWTNGLAKSPRERATHTQRAPSQPLFHAFILGHMRTPWRPQDYEHALRLLKDNRDRWDLVEEVLTGLAGQTWPAAQNKTIDAIFRTVLDHRWGYDSLSGSLAQRILAAHGKASLDQLSHRIETLLLPNAPVPPGHTVEEMNRAANRAQTAFETWQRELNKREFDWFKPWYARHITSDWTKLTLSLHPDALAFLARPENSSHLEESLQPLFTSLTASLRRGEPNRWMLTQGNVALVLDGNKLGLRALPPEHSLEGTLVLEPHKDDATLRSIPAGRRNSGAACPFALLEGQRPSQWALLKAKFTTPRVRRTANIASLLAGIAAPVTAAWLGTLHQREEREQRLATLPPKAAEVARASQTDLDFSFEEAMALGQKLRGQPDPLASYGNYLHAYRALGGLSKSGYQLEKATRLQFAERALQRPNPSAFADRMVWASHYLADEPGENLTAAEQLAASGMKDDELFGLGYGSRLGRLLNNKPEATKAFAQTALAKYGRDSLTGYIDGYDFATDQLRLDRRHALAFGENISQRPRPTRYLSQLQAAFDYAHGEMGTEVGSAYRWADKVMEQADPETYLKTYLSIYHFAKDELALDKGDADRWAARWVKEENVAERIDRSRKAYHYAKDELEMDWAESVNWANRRAETDPTQYIEAHRKAYHYAKDELDMYWAESVNWASRAAENNPTEYVDWHRKAFRYAKDELKMYWADSVNWASRMADKDPTAYIDAHRQLFNQAKDRGSNWHDALYFANKNAAR